MSLLALRDVGVSFGPCPVLSDVSLEIAAGEFVALIGPNGAGKSTLLKAIAGLQPHQGQIRLFDREQLEPRERARRLAYLPQNGQVHWPLTARQVAMLGRAPHRVAFAGPSPDDEKLVDRALERADASAFAERRIDQLSGGERGRVLIARALAGAPQLLLADEPTAALDPLHQLTIMDLLGELAREGMAVIAVLHDLALAARACPRLVLLQAGRIVADGAPEAVLTRARLAQVYGLDGELRRIDGQPVLLAQAGNG